MIYGIVAEQPPVSGGGPTPRSVLDFVAHTYVCDGSTLTAADVISDTSRISGNGLEIISGSPVAFMGAPLTILLGGQWTVIIEFNSTAVVSDRLFLLSIFDATVPEGTNNQIALYTVDNGSYQESNFSTSTFRSISGDGSAISGLNRCGYTRTDSHASVSLNGEAVGVNNRDNTALTIASWSPNPPTQAQAADGNNPPTHEGYIRKISIYSPQSDSILSTLSA